MHNTKLAVDFDTLGVMDDETKTVAFHYIKSSGYRMIHTDGALGGVVPQGSGLFLAMFSEHLPIPQTTTHAIDAQGNLSQPVSQQSRDGLVREVEIGMHMSIPSARSLHLFLGNAIREAEADMLIKTHPKKTE